MAERHVSVHRQQTVGPGRQGRLRRHAQPRRRPPHEGGVADRFCRRHQQEQPGLRRQRVDPRQEALLDVPGQRAGLQQAEATRHLGRGESAWQLEQSKGIAPGLDHDPIANAPIEPGRGGRVQQRTSIGGR
jgi:hypothetical protein